MKGLDTTQIPMPTGIREKVWNNAVSIKEIVGLDISDLIRQAFLDENWGNCLEKADKSWGPIVKSTIIIPHFMVKAIEGRAVAHNVSKRTVVAAMLKQQVEVTLNKIQRYAA